MSVATRVASSAPEFYEWSFPGAPVKVHLHLHVVEALKEALPADTTVSPAPQLQGILLGRSPAIGCIEVSDFRPLLSTEPDDLERAIGSLKAGPDEILPIGFYETCNDEHLHLQENTISLARYFLTDPNCVFLAIQPAPAGSASAGFFFWDKGDINGEFCFMEFPFDPATLATMQQAKLEMAQPKPAPVLKPPAFATPPPEKSEHSWRRLAGAVSLVLLAAAAGMGVVAFFERKAGWSNSDVQNAQNPGEASIDLKMERNGADLTLSWDRNSPIVRSAQKGRLSIKDGEAKQEIELDAWQLRTGSVLYSASSSQIWVQLDVIGPDQKVKSASIMALMPVSGAIQPQTAPPLPKVPGAPATATAPVRKPLPSREFQPPPAEQPVSSESLPESPDVKPVPQSAHVSPLLSAAVIPQLPPLRPSSPAAPDASPASPAASPATSQRSTSEASRSVIPSEAVYTPPRPARQIMPIVPPNVNSLIRGRLVVEVKVTIDATGKVIKAEPVARGHIHEAVLQTALHAALLWKFEPAHRGDQPLPSESRIEFIYH